MRSRDGQESLKKSVSLLTNSEPFAVGISKQCSGDHEHRVVQGVETAHSAAYPTALATAVFHAYNKAKQETVESVYAAAASSSSAVAIEPTADAETEEVTYGAQAITFKGKVNPEVASVLKRVHQNLGHPPNRELVKHLKIAGAGESVLRAAEQLVCRTCAKSTKAPLHKVSAPASALDFNEAVALDIIWLDTVDAKNIPALNIVDLASTYQVVVPLSSTKSAEVSDAFVSGWIQWAGAPGFVLVDLDSAFKDRFLTLMDQKSIVVRAAAGQAHWQNGVAERHGGSWKVIWDKLVEDKLVTLDETIEAAAFVSDAKNLLRNRSGYSPRQWVFGCNGRQPQDLLDMDSQEIEAIDLASPDTKFARSQVLRVGAKAACFACQSKEAVQRAINHKPRVDDKTFEVGDLVYAWRKVRQGRANPEMHFIVKTRRFAHFIMKTPGGKRPIPPKPMCTKGLTKASTPTAVFSPRTHQSCPAHGKNSRVFTAIHGVFTANSRKIHGLFFSMFFTHKKQSLMHLGLIFSILKIYYIYSWGI